MSMDVLWCSIVGTGDAFAEWIICFNQIQKLKWQLVKMTGSASSQKVYIRLRVHFYVFWATEATIVQW